MGICLKVTTASACVLGSSTSSNCNKVLSPPVFSAHLNLRKRSSINSVSGISWHGDIGCCLWGFPLLGPSYTCKWPPPAMPPGAFRVQSCSSGSSWQNRPRRWLLRGSRNLFSAYLFVMAGVRLRCREVGQLLRALSAANSDNSALKF